MRLPRLYPTPSGSSRIATRYRKLCANFIESSCYPLGCDPPYLAVGAGKSNNCSKEPIKASESFLVPLKPIIILYSDSYTLHNGSQSLLSALNTQEARTQLITRSYQRNEVLFWWRSQEGLEQLRAVFRWGVTSMIPAVLQGFGPSHQQLSNRFRSILGAVQSGSSRSSGGQIQSARSFFLWKFATD